MRPWKLLVAVSIAACSATPDRAPSFTGAWVGNERESIMLPGQKVPKNMTAYLEDDGRFLRTAQVYLDAEGKEIRRLVWNGACDGTPGPITGKNLPGSATLSCRRVEPGAVQMELIAADGYSHTEICRMAPDGQKHTCAGTATLPDGSKHDFVYVFDRKTTASR